MPFWINLDADPNRAADIHATVPPIPFADGELDEIYAGHLIEHMGREVAGEFLRECYRCLKPGGILTVVVPDTREIMRRYLMGTIDCVEYPFGVWRPIKDLDTICALFLYSTVQESRHQWSYDAQSLRRAMERAGFTSLREIDRYMDRRIAIGAWYQCGIEGHRP